MMIMMMMTRFGFFMLRFAATLVFFRQMFAQICAGRRRC